MKNKLNCILLVDDDRATNYLNELIVVRADCTEHVEVAEDGQQALEFLLSGIEGISHLPNIIFLDINMPRMNGWEFVEEFKKLQIIKGEILIVMLTASVNPDDQTKAEAIEEISIYYNKPLSVEKINEMLQEYFADRL